MIANRLRYHANTPEHICVEYILNTGKSSARCFIESRLTSMGFLRQMVTEITIQSPRAHITQNVMTALIPDDLLRSYGYKIVDNGVEVAIDAQEYTGSSR